MTEKPPKFVAFHEAGHTVVEMVLFPWLVEIEARVWRRAFVPFGFHRSFGATVDPADPMPGLRKMSAVSYAGPIAESIDRQCDLQTVLYDGGEHGADMWEIEGHAARALLLLLDDMLFVGDEDFKHRWLMFKQDWLAFAERWARDLVNNRWDWITRVADHLDEHGRITGAEVKRLRPRQAPALPVVSAVAWPSG